MTFFYLAIFLAPTIFSAPEDEDAMTLLDDVSPTLDLHTVPTGSGPDYAVIVWGVCALLSVMAFLIVCFCGIRVLRR